MTIPQRIAQQYRETFFEGSQLGFSLRDQLEDVDWRAATARQGRRHPIATLTFHVGYYLQAIISVLRDQPLTTSDRQAFEHPPVTNAEDWKRLTEQVWRQAEHAIRLIEHLPEERLHAPFGEERYGSVFRNLLGILEHAIYHMGQITWAKQDLASGETPPAG